MASIIYSLVVAASCKKQTIGAKKKKVGWMTQIRLVQSQLWPTQCAVLLLPIVESPVSPVCRVEQGKNRIGIYVKCYKVHLLHRQGLCFSIRILLGSFVLILINICLTQPIFTNTEMVMLYTSAEILNSKNATSPPQKYFSEDHSLSGKKKQRTTEHY